MLEHLCGALLREVVHVKDAVDAAGADEGRVELGDGAGAHDHDTAGGVDDAVEGVEEASEVELIGAVEQKITHAVALQSRSARGGGGVGLAAPHNVKSAVDLHQEDNLIVGNSLGLALAVRVGARVLLLEHNVVKLLVRLDLFELEGDDVAAEVRSERLHEGRLAGAGGPREEEAELPREALNRELAAAEAEIVDEAEDV